MTGQNFPLWLRIALGCISPARTAGWRVRSVFKLVSCDLRPTLGAALLCKGMRMELTKEQRQAIITWAEKTSEIEAVFLFGSMAKGTATTDSDIDLALVMTKGPERDQRAGDYLRNWEAWEAELKTALAIEVYLGSLDPPMGQQVPNAVAECNIELWRRVS